MVAEKIVNSIGCHFFLVRILSMYVTYATKATTTNILVFIFEMMYVDIDDMKQTNQLEWFEKTKRKVFIWIWDNASHSPYHHRLFTRCHHYNLLTIFAIGISSTTKRNVEMNRLIDGWSIIQSYDHATDVYYHISVTRWERICEWWKYYR